MNHYFKIFFAFIRNNFTRAMEYRSDFIIAMILNLVWVGFNFWILLTLYNYTSSIAGWTREQVIVLYGVFRFAKGFFDMLVRKNHIALPDSINSGDLDYNLTRPINTLFLSTFRFHSMTEISSVIFGIAIFLYSLTLVHFNLDLNLILRCLVSVSVAFIAYYSLMTFIVTFSFFISRFTAINEVNSVVSQTMRFPTSAFSRNNWAIDLLLIPIAMIATKPASVIVNTNDYTGLVLEIFLGGLMFYLMYRFWLFALSKYSSASS